MINQFYYLYLKEWIKFCFVSRRFTKVP